MTECYVRVVHQPALERLTWAQFDIEVLESLTTPCVAQNSGIAQTKAANGIKAANNFQHIRIRPSEPLTELSVFMWYLVRLSDVDLVLFAFQNHRSYAIDELEILFGFPKFVFGGVLLIRRPEWSEVLHVVRLEYANVRDKACDTPGSESTPRETEAENLISFIVVVDEEIVGLKYIDDEAITSTTLSSLFKPTQGPSPYSRVIVNNLLPLLTFSILSCLSNCTCQSCNVGGYVASTRHR